MRFWLRQGTHKQDGQIYKKGSVIESPHDLSAVNSRKFKRLEDKPAPVRPIVKQNG